MKIWENKKKYLKKYKKYNKWKYEKIIDESNNKLKIWENNRWK